MPGTSGSAVDAAAVATSAAISVFQMVTSIDLCKIQIRTTADHGLADGDFVSLSGLFVVSEATSFKVNKIDNDEFILSGINSTANVSES